MKKTILLSLLLISLGLDSIAQSISLSTPLLEEYLRRKQLTGEIPDNFSFMVKPINPTQLLGIDLEEGLPGYDHLDRTGKYQYLEKKNTVKVQPLPIIVNTQFNSAYPFAQNNGAMIPNRGIQMLISGGAYIEYGKFSFQLQPEFLTAQNKGFRGMPSRESSNWKDYYQYLNRIDEPEQFGTGTYTRATWGNSSIRYNFDNGISVGVSNEYLWWGPSKRNSLMMSNNAPGFLHFTVNTQKPIETNIGSFEGQVIAGRLENSGFLPPNPGMVFRRTPLYVPKRDEDWRYLAGMVLTYQPKWIPGFSIGYSSTSQIYHNDMDRFGDFLPIFNGRKRFSHLDDPIIAKRQQQSAGFFRWFSTKGKFEFYGEYGSNGNSKRLREFIVNPDLNRAFTLGFVKYIPLQKDEQFIQVHLEMSQTGQTTRKAIRENMTWYTHPHVRHGYTNQGQVMGFGHGGGSNSLFVEASWINNFNRIGLQFERIANKNDSFYLHFEHINGWDRYWVDIVPSLVADRKIGQFLVSTRLQFVNTLNYYWVLERDPNAPLYRLQSGDDRKNIVAHINLAYFF
ncbi:capsule assembly Wzi family protein [Belliella marina]|uniref:Capsule assembly Wzi family protein n=1 Tax=Belliella marina TaxID=1644146 RepID=A0ABW4VI98_9BACT